MHWLDITRAVLDVTIVTFLLYKTITMLHGTRAIQILKGVGVVLVVWLLSGVLGLTTLKFILSQVILYGLLGMLILFQPELRNALERIGKRSNRPKPNLNTTDTQNTINSITSASEYLAKRKIGALICIQQQDPLDEYVQTGIALDAKISQEILTNIFTPNVPLHDGALIIQNNRIASASCVLPLSDSDTLDKDLGTRHRASIGLSEVSDAIAVIVSEETGRISLAKNAKLIRGITPEELKTHLEMFLNVQKSTPKT